MRKSAVINILILIISFIILALFTALAPQKVNAQDCSSYSSCGGSTPAVCCCNNVLVTDPNYATACSCEPAGGYNSNPCSRYGCNPTDYTFSETSCGENICANTSDRCYNPDGNQSSNYAYSCCSSGSPTPPPATGDPSNWQCRARGIAETKYGGCEGVFNIDPPPSFGIGDSGYTCSNSCDNLTFDSYITEPLPYECLERNVQSSYPDSYLFSCCSYNCGRPWLPPVPGPGGITPAPGDYPGWPSNYPPPPTDAIPPPYVSCNQERPDNLLHILTSEFHSLRPYQASPCRKAFRMLARYCGNNLTIRRDESMTYTLGAIIASCKNNNDGTSNCTETFQRDEPVAVNLSGAELPIMGNTQLGSNSKNPLGPADDEAAFPRTVKVNEYVSWYLNGVNERAEYPYLDVEKNCIGEETGREGTCRWTNPPLFRNACSPPPLPSWEFDGDGGCSGGNLASDLKCCVNTIIDSQTDMLDRDKLINFSGPLKKLLPIRIQHEKRIGQTRDALLSSQKVNRTRHNQTAGCVYRIKIPGTKIEFFNIPARCYFGGPLGIIDLLFTPFRKEVRLADWQIKDKLPPLEEDYANQTWTDFLIDYKEWRGLACYEFDPFPKEIKIGPIVIPPPDFLSGKQFFFCFDTPTRANFWANIFTYIPFSSTEDMLGSVEVQSTRVQPRTSVNYEVINAEFIPDGLGFAFLYFPHMDEVDKLAKPLQQTYAPRQADLLEIIDTESGEVDPYCDLREIRTNPGDDLFAGEILGTLSYEVAVNYDFFNGSGTGEKWCDSEGGKCGSNDNRYCANNYGNLDCPAGEVCRSGCKPLPSNTNSCDSNLSTHCVPNNWTGSFCISNLDPTITCGSQYYKCVYDVGFCSAPSAQTPVQSQAIPVYTTMKLVTKTPKADHVWRRLVAGAAGVVRKMFPKVAPDIGSPLEEFRDMPAATSVTYSSSNPNIKVQAGNPGAQRSGQGAELYFPHIGGIKEYFLSGIQTLLRPKGYGNITGGSITPVGTCELGVGYCSVQELSSFCEYNLSGASAASQVCSLESGGDPTVINNKCQKGETYDFSVGLFQINLIAHCPTAFASLDPGSNTCTIDNELGVDCTGYNSTYPITNCNQTLKDCIDFYLDPDKNREKMASLSNQCTSFTPWLNAQSMCNLYNVPSGIACTTPTTFGTSADGTPLVYYQLGTGSKARAIIGGIHGGYESNTVALVNELLTNICSNPLLIPDDVTLYVIPNLNPDGYAAGQWPCSPDGPCRLNGNGVDLNRNWDYGWKDPACYDPSCSIQVSAGGAPFSESESSSLRDLVSDNGIDATLFYHSSGGNIYYGAVGSTSQSLAQIVSSATGYPVYLPASWVTGDATDYLSDNGVPSIIIELTSHSSTDLSQNLNALEAFLNW